MGKTWEVARVVIRFRALIRELAARDLKDRYLNHALGGAWALLSPLLILVFYVYLFTIVFPARLGDDPTSLNAMVWILIGLVTWTFATEVMNRAVTAISAAPSLVQRVVFPIEIIPMQTVAVQLLGFVIGLVLVLVVQAFNAPQTLIGTLWLLPPALLLLGATLVGLAYLLAGLGPFLRDLREIVQFFSMVGMFIAPVLYLPGTMANLNPLLAAILAINPFTHLINCQRDALFHGSITAPISWIVAALFASFILVAGTTIYQRVKPHFAEAL